MRWAVLFLMACGVLQAETLSERFTTPEGFSRVPVDAESFGHWLRNVPLKAEGSPVLLHSGARKIRQDVHAAVLEISVGDRDLQQCADAVIRLRAEYLKAVGRENEIAFNFTSGDRCAWSAWTSGQRPVVKGSQVQWRDTHQADSSESAFTDYLNTVFSFAGSASLEKELAPVSALNIQPGDVFIQSGFPGHAVIVMDVAVNESGVRKMLLAQSYMPAQSIHVLKNPNSESAWYDVHKSGALETPEWTFRYEDLRRFP
ncbi:MAG: DUF4846 domain-containing protein [Calditrichaeota bacterium]|nr:DUF4846 domain-containing protein [Calditrichota bacterium]